MPHEGTGGMRRDERPETTLSGKAPTRRHTAGGLALFISRKSKRLCPRASTSCRRWDRLPSVKLNISQAVVRPWPRVAVRVELETCKITTT